MSVFALLTLIASSSEPGQAQDLVFKNARIVVSPGNVIDSGSIRVRDGKIVEVKKGAISGAGETVDASGMTIYAAFVHSGLNATIAGVSPERGARPAAGSAQERDAQAERDKDPFSYAANFRYGSSVAGAEKLSVSALAGLAKNGFGTAVVGATGGLISAQPAVVNTGKAEVEGAKALDLVPVSVNGRGAGGYPGSTMGTIAFIRQTMIDSQGYSGTDEGLKKLSLATSGSVPTYFPDLNEVSFFQAKRIAQEFGLKPVYGFRSDAGAVVSHLKGATIILQGSSPAKPRLGANLDGVSLSGVRDYFKEVQVGAELERAKVDFVYQPTTESSPFEGLRTYVQGGLSRKAAIAAITVNPAKALGLEGELGTLEAGKRANLVMVQGDILDSSSQVMATYIDGKAVDFEMPKKKEAKDLRADEPLKLPKPNYVLFPAPAETKQAFRLYKNATVWTQGKMGTVENCDVLVQNGKFVAVGKNLTAPRGCEVIDATGKHISPGLWDAHSHTAISGGVNEFSNMITAECRIRDVVNHTDSSVYTQLSGGTIGAMQLHGSANAIGGQSNTVKWRWGMEPDEYAVKGAPEGVKFALGQNPIREDGGASNVVGGTLLTFRPRTRMGVEEAVRKALQLGIEYNEAWADFKADRRKDKPRRDLQLEALGEIVSQERWIHSHAYRADEMLMLIRITKEFGPKLATLQHVLEGYKIADEMAEMGVGGSTFSDWWGFKLESYDAIPFNAALMAERGVVVSVNSDSDNHARRMNQEAAKSMRFGGASAEVALSFVTTGPAKQLGIDQWTGSIEPGKDADMVLWTHEPMSIKAVALETYVDGVKRFDRKNDADQRAARVEELEEARKVLAGSDSPFRAGDPDDAAEVDMSPTKAQFGLATISGQPGTARYPRDTTLIKGATIHPMSGEPFVGDVLLGADGKISQVGQDIFSKGADVVDGSGKHVYPGLIDPATGLGMNEIGQVPASDDSSERGSFHPDYKPERSMNPEWDSLAVARHQGILTAIVKPSGGGIPGQAALIHTEGYTWEDMTIQSGAALMYSLGGGGGRFGDGRTDQVRCCEMTEESGHNHDEHESEQEGHLHTEDCDHDLEFTSGRVPLVQGSPDRLSTLTDRLKEAKTYREKRSAATPDAPVARDQALDAMLEVVDGKMPVMISVTTGAEIQSAVLWAEANGIKVVLYGCGGAGEIAEWLAAKQVPVILAAVYGQPRADQPLDYFYGLPGRLAKAGVKFGLTTNDNHDVRQLRDQAGWASTYGLGSENAARSITYWTAQILGIDDRLGSIQPGLDGTVILTDGEITETQTKVLRAWIQSREVPLENRQTRFYDKYRNRPMPNRIW